MAIAIWNPTQFVVRYPEFTAALGANPALFAEYFAEAGYLYLNNGNASPVQDVLRRGRLLNMLVAHIASLSGITTADGQPKPVGRISQAAEGTVSASLEMNPPTPGSGPWFAQSQYGASFWQATTSLRGFRYRARPTDYRQWPWGRGGF